MLCHATLGILTAHAVLGYGLWELLVAKRNLIEDLMAMDEDEQGRRLPPEATAAAAAKKAA
jgi:hypothetical protein